MIDRLVTERLISEFKTLSKNSCGNMFCTTCGGYFRIVVDNVRLSSIKTIKDLLKTITLHEVDKYFGEWQYVLSHFDPDGFSDIFIREAKQVDLSDTAAVDQFLIKTRREYKDSNTEFSDLYKKILKYAISKSVSESNESLTETVIVVLREKAKEYHGLLEYALSVSRHNNQMKRVLYNFFREEIKEVRDYTGDGSTSFAWY